MLIILQGECKTHDGKSCREDVFCHFVSLADQYSDAIGCPHIKIFGSYDTLLVSLNLLSRISTTKARRKHDESTMSESNSMNRFGELPNSTTFWRTSRCRFPTTLIQLSSSCHTNRIFTALILTAYRQGARKNRLKKN